MWTFDAGINLWPDWGPDIAPSDCYLGGPCTPNYYGSPTDAQKWFAATVSNNMFWMVTKVGCSSTEATWTNQSGACVPGGVASSSHTAGIQVGLADGSVHFVAQGVRPTTWWYALTAGSEDVLGSDW
jgi:hypothetical protein